MLRNHSSQRWIVAERGTEAPNVARLVPQRGLDLAVDSLELGVEISRQRLQAPFAEIDDLPELAALRVAQRRIGEADSRLHDFAAPLPGARVDRFDGPVWHARH